MKDKIIRAITCDGAVKISAISAKEMVNEAVRLHGLMPLTAAALGRTLIAASLLGNDLKGEESSLTIRIDGDGPIGSIIAVSDSDGNVRGCCTRPLVDLPLRADGKIDVGSGVGKNGTISMIKDLSMKEPYIGQVALTSGEIAEDVTGYLAVSEQIPSVCALGVLIDRDYSVRAAGGYIIQLLPGVYEDELTRLEECVAKARAVTECLDSGMSIEQIVRETLEGFDIEFLFEGEAKYKCTCSRERTRGVLLSLGEEELLRIREEDGKAELSCGFCNSKYEFSGDEILEIANEAKK